jgi:hypothetical protein
VSILEQLLGDLSWHERAACRPSACTLGSERFVPVLHARQGQRGDQFDPYAGLRVCEPCVVRAECAAYAQGMGIRVGVWGGRMLGNDPGKARGAGIRGWKV